jgi:DNA polymerase
MVSLFEVEREMRQVREEVVDCKRCDLWRTRSNPVFGEGPVDADVMFVGEAPGHNEDLQGKPFVGKAGGLFEELLCSVGLRRDEVYVTNLIKCRPAKNRNPLKGEIRACCGYLDRQIMIIKPRVIVTLGNFALSYVFEKFGLKVDRIGKVHGGVFRVKDIVLDASIVPLYHPAAAVYNPRMKKVLLEDFESIRKALHELK